MSEELKPCPFCGGAPVASPTRTSYIVECNNAGCKVNPDALATFKHDAIAAWNRRATPSTSPASEAGELPPPVAPKGPFADYSAEEVEAYAKDYARAALASTRTASDTRTAAGEAECDAALGP